MKLFIATPCFANSMSMQCALSLIQLQTLCVQQGIHIQHYFLGNESLIQRARNRLVHQFLKSDCTHLLFLDSDLGFQPIDVIRLIHADKDVIGGCYPAKGINWFSVKKAIELKPDISDEELEYAAGKFVVGVLPGNESFQVGSPVEVKELGTGFLCVRRNVFETMSQQMPELLSFEGHEQEDVYTFFDCVVDDDGRYTSEDYGFAYRWRKLGGQVWLLPDIELEHVGSYSFKGSMKFLAALESTEVDNSKGQV